MSLAIKLPRAVAFFAFVTLLCLSASAQKTQKTLTDDSIIQMSGAHLDTEIILNAIHTMPGQYSLAPDDLIRLKTAGVSNAIVAAMQQQAQAPAPADMQSPISLNNQVESWTLHQLGDPMSKSPGTVAVTTITGQHGGVLELTAECHNDLALGLDLVSKTPGITFKRIAMAQRVVVNRPVNGVATGVASPPRYCANFRVQADDGPIGQASSQLCEDDSNAEILFPGDAAKLAIFSSKELNSLIAPATSEDGASKGSAIMDALGEFGAVMAQQTAPQIDALTGTVRMAQVVKADSLAIELTFATGQQAIITLHPHAPVLGPYLARCMSVSPVPNDPVANLRVVPRTPLPQLARFGPGHSIFDSYARSIDIAQQNQTRGIQDPLDKWTSMQPVDVCFSITESRLPNGNVKRTCDKTGEVVRVPGDLSEQEGFWRDIGAHCKAANWNGLNVRLNPPPSDGKKRMIDCTDIQLLSAKRDQMRDQGVH